MTLFAVHSVEAELGLNGEQTRKENCNECNTDNGGCEKHCKDSPGSFKCYCDNGYRSQGKKCESKYVVIDIFVEQNDNIFIIMARKEYTFSIKVIIIV